MYRKFLLIFLVSVLGTYSMGICSELIGPFFLNSDVSFLLPDRWANPYHKDWLIKFCKEMTAEKYFVGGNIELNNSFRIPPKTTLYSYTPNGKKIINYKSSSEFRFDPEYRCGKMIIRFKPPAFSYRGPLSVDSGFVTNYKEGVIYNMIIIRDDKGINSLPKEVYKWSGNLKKDSGIRAWKIGHKDISWIFSKIEYSGNKHVDNVVLFKNKSDINELNLGKNKTCLINGAYDIDLDRNIEIHLECRNYDIDSTHQFLEWNGSNFVPFEPG